MRWNQTGTVGLGGCALNFAVLFSIPASLCFVGGLAWQEVMLLLASLCFDSREKETIHHHPLVLGSCC